jgi:RND family efflux transporter MFP subunit
MKTIGIVLLLALAGCAKKEVAKEVKKAEAVSLKTAAVEERMAARTVDLTGSLVPDETVNLSSEVQGRIAAIHADFGQTVRKGQVIVELDRRELEWQVERARAAQTQALARLGLSSSNPDALPTTTAAIRQAEALFEDAKTKHQNGLKLLTGGDIAKERVTELEKQLDLRRAALDQAKDELNVQLAQVRSLAADVKLAAKRLDDTQVRAPFDGMVSQRMLSPGQFIKDNTPILTVVKTSPLRLRVDVPESVLSMVRPGATLSFSTEAAPGASFTAVVRQLNPAIDARSRSLTVEARLTKEDARLKPGSFVQLQLNTTANSAATVVPRVAVYRIAGLSKFFVVKNGRALERRFEPGLEFGDFVEVPSGLTQPGDRVAVTNLAMLSDGLAVAVR